MLRQLFRDTVVYGAANVFSRGIAILLIPVYTHAFEPSEYGAIDFLVLIGTLINLTVALEISQGVARFYTNAQSMSDKVAYASSALYFTAAAYVLFSVVVLRLSGPISIFILESQDLEKLFRAAVIATAANGIFFHVQNQLRWEFKVLPYAVASGLFAVITGVVAVLLILVAGKGPASVFYGQVTGALVGGLVSLYFVRKSFRLQFGWRQWREMVWFSLPLVASSVAVFLSVYIDRFFIKELLGLAEVGIYGVGYRFASVVGLLVAGFQGALTPIVYKNYLKSSTPNDLAKILRYFVLAVLPVSLMIGVFAREIISLFATQAYSEAWSVIPILTFGIVLANMYIFAPGLFIRKKTGRFAAINIGAAVLNGGLNVALIPILGIVGAAVATTFTGALAFAAFMVMSQRLYPVPHDWASLIVPTGAVVLLIFIGLVYSGGDQSLAHTVLFKLGVCGAGTAIAAHLLLGGEERATIKLKFRRAVSKR